MSETFYIKQNDTKPDLKAALLDGAGAVVDITGATVVFKMYREGSSAKVNSSASIVTASTGEVKYEWAAADTDTANTYRGEFQVTYSGGGVQTFPSDGWIEIIITDDAD